ncbi:MAG: hypothetical protein ACREFW_03530 [Rhizomicrobium sp.]
MTPAATLCSPEQRAGTAPVQSFVEKPVRSLTAAFMEGKGRALPEWVSHGKFFKCRIAQFRIAQFRIAWVPLRHGGTEA